MEPQEKQALLQEPDLDLYAPFGVQEHNFHDYHKFVYLKEEAISKRLTSFAGLSWGMVIKGFEYFEPQPDMIKVGQSMIPVDQLQAIADEKYEKAVRRYLEKVNSENGQPVEEEYPTAPADVREAQSGKIIYDLPMGIVWGTFYVNGEGRDFLAGDTEVSLGKEPNTRKLNTLKAAYTDAMKRGSRMFGVGAYLTEVGSAKTRVADYRTLKKWLAERYPNDPRFWEIEKAKEGLMEEMNAFYPSIYKSREDVGTALINMRILSFDQDNYYDIRKSLIKYAEA